MAEDGHHGSGAIRTGHTSASRENEKLRRTRDDEGSSRWGKTERTHLRDEISKDGEAIDAVGLVEQIPTWRDQNEFIVETCVGAATQAPAVRGRSSETAAPQARNPNLFAVPRSNAGHGKISSMKGVIGRTIARDQPSGETVDQAATGGRDGEQIVRRVGEAGLCKAADMRHRI
ncbi:hypothetical protein JOD31_000708 [Methylopila capsulata]|uniref:Uncharacterized protein n=1 Tax=Methylopila capsulata TaxID=61654 RepID=A0A9W6IV03_9HYPH|nr:hypothetical protein [Methylopila capsulata]MBM7850496.1 hypothetical protein [Methylopila capsulata]GLK55790.1 hypothetical protein GCM10008170_18090 [Methylopila capsulata]